LRYRKFGALDWEVSAFGLSLGGLPLEEAGPTRPDRAAGTAGVARPDRAAEGAGVAGHAGAAETAGATEADCVRLIRHAIDHGVNYLDLGYPYDPARQRRVAEVAGRALQGGYREQVKIAVTVPVAGAATVPGAALVPGAHPGVAADRARADNRTGSFDQHLDAQLDWLGTDRADFCVLGRVDRQTWPVVKERGLLQAAERALVAGRVGDLGFAFHDQFQILKQVLRDYDRWAFAQFQYSYMDVAHDPGSLGLVYAADQGLAVVVTETLKRGLLTKEPPRSATAVWAAAGRGWSPAEWALRFVLNNPAVSTAVCGIETMDQLVEDLALADKAEAGALAARDELAINRVRDAYEALRPIDCASCRPCLPCPEGIDIPRVFEIYNDAIIYDDVKTASALYRDEGHRADACTGCVACEERCTRHTPLPVVAWLATAHELLGGSERREEEEWPTTKSSTPA
jgi:predicted aldo/keto reductase-like oxidoreductase